MNNTKDTCHNTNMSTGSSAVLSEDRLYRYNLTRTWESGPRVTFVMLNPSTADETANDRTLVRCMNFAKNWGFSGLTVVNLYAYRATKPKQLWTISDPVGPENNFHLEEAAASSELLVAAWGGIAKKSRVREVLSLSGFDRLTCLAVTKSGAPRHPLYLRKTSGPVPWPGPQNC